MPEVSNRSSLRRISPAARRSLGILFAVLGAAYLVVVLMAYFQITAPNSLVPDFIELDRMLFGHRAKPVSTIERLLETADGPLNGSGSMRPAFTEQSVEWESLTGRLTEAERSVLIAEREGERLALLSWVQSGADRKSYEEDSFLPNDTEVASMITDSYLVADSPRIRIRTLLNDRCATCHSEMGRNEKARSFPLDNYDDLAPYCKPESIQVSRPVWLVAALLAMLPLALLTGPIFYLSRHPLGTRVVLIAIPALAIAVAICCWVVGRPGGVHSHVLLGASTVGAIGILVQMAASASDLFVENRE